MLVKLQQSSKEYYFYWLIIYRVTNVLILVADQLAATDVSEGATKKKQTRGLCHLVLILLILKKPCLDLDHIHVYCML